MLNTTKLERIIKKFGKDEAIKLDTNLESERLDFLMGMPEPSSGFAPRWISFQNYTGTDLLAEMQGLDTSNLTSCANMFYNCKNITKADMSGWDLSNVTTMGSCFAQDTALKEVVFPTTKSNKITSVAGMFSMCKGLTRLDLSNFEITGLREISSCFRENTNLEYLNLSGWHGELTSVNYFLNWCSKLKFLDIRNLSFKKITTDYTYTFNQVPKDCLIIVKDDTEKTIVSGNLGATLTNVKTIAEYIAEGGE